MGKNPASPSFSSSSVNLTDGKSKRLSANQAPDLSTKYDENIVQNILIPAKNSKNNIEKFVIIDHCEEGGLNDEAIPAEVSETHDEDAYSDLQTANISSISGTETNIEQQKKSSSDPGSKLQHYDNKNASLILQSSSSIPSSSSSSSSSSPSSFSFIHSSNSIHKSVADIETEFVELSLDMLGHIRVVIEMQFQNHPCFLKALKDGITTFVNKDSSVMCVDKTPVKDINILQKRNKKQNRKSNKRQKECSENLGILSGSIIFDQEAKADSESEDESVVSSDDVINNETSGSHIIDKVTSTSLIPHLNPNIMPSHSSSSVPSTPTPTSTCPGARSS